MKNHISEEKLLKSVLQTLEDQEELKVTKHIDDCEICRSKFTKLKNEMDLIGNIKFDITEKIPHLPVRKQYLFFKIMKAAAILLIGFFAGYSASEIVHPQNVQIVKQHLITGTYETTITEFVSCE